MYIRYTYVHKVHIHVCTSRERILDKEFGEIDDYLEDESS